MAFKLALFLAILPVLVNSFYTIGYFAGSMSGSALGGKVSTFTAAPDSIHVADLVARLSGYPALLREGLLSTYYYMVFAQYYNFGFFSHF